MSKFLFIVLILSLINYFNRTIGEINDPQFCFQPTCKAVESEILASINRESDPCDDFYLFVCSGWEKKWMENQQVTYRNQFTRMKQLLRNILKELLKRSPHIFYSDRFSLIEDRLRSFFISCMDAESRKREAVNNLNFLLNNIGGFPLIGVKLDRDYHWEDTVGTLIRYLNFNDIFFHLDVRKNLKQTRKNIIVFDRPTSGNSLNISFSSMTEGNNLTQYENMVMKTISKLRQTNGNSLEPPDQREITRLIRHVSGFESQLSEIAEKLDFPDMSFTMKGIELYMNFRVKEAQEIIGNQTDLIRLLQQVFNGIADIKEDTEVTLPSEEYFRKLGEILARTNKKTIANYIGLKVLQKFGEVAALNLDEHDTRNRLEDICISTMLDLLNVPSTVAYSISFRTGERHLQSVSGIIKDLKNAFKASISAADWIDEKSKSGHLAKIEEMREQLFGPENLFNINFISIFSQMNVADNDFFDSYVLLSRINAENKLKLINLDHNETQHWINNVAEPMPFYLQESNTIYVPVLSIRTPIHHTNLPATLNYGALGSIIGREMAKIIITNEFEHGGNYRNRLFSNEEYLKKLKCFKNQYAAYRDLVNGNQVDNKDYEALADNIGLHLAYKAFREPYKILGEIQRIYLSNLHFNRLQMFFISYAYSLCGTHNAESAYEYYRMKRQSPPRVRLMGTLVNSEEFMTTFNCTGGFKTHVKDKCTFF